jgi:hypothetical protein
MAVPQTSYEGLLPMGVEMNSHANLNNALR